MLLFCPSCSNQLIITTLPASHCTPSSTASHAGKNTFTCRTCPYQMLLDRRYYERKTMRLKPVGDILGGAESWENVDRAEVKCANDACDSRTAYFRQVQIRSADEPMTSFYKCVKCAKEWREN